MAKKRPKIKLPNGFGSITELSGNRRKPYMVYVTTGWDASGKQIKEIIGYAKDWYEGYDMLSEYHKSPNYLEDKEKEKITADFIFNLLKNKMEKEIGKPGMSKSNYVNLVSAYKNHCIAIHNKSILSLTYFELQNLIDNCNCSFTIRGYIKNICIRIFNYGKLFLSIPLDLDIVERLDTGEKQKSEMHIPLTDQELESLWLLYESQPNDEIEIVLMLIYTGMRPKELIDIELTKVFTENQYMIGGCKTKAGKDRILPIHKDILPFVNKRLTNKKYLIENVLGKKTTYKYISKVWEKVMSIISAKHYPYDARHTLGTKLDEYKIKHPNSLIDDLTIKLIMGHAITDITQNVYIHRDAKYLVEAINLLDLGRRNNCL